MDRAAAFNAAACRFTFASDEFVGKFGVNLPVRSLSCTASLNPRQDWDSSLETAQDRPAERISPHAMVSSGVVRSAPRTRAIQIDRPSEPDTSRKIRAVRFRDRFMA